MWRLKAKKILQNSAMHATFLWILFSKCRIWIQGSGSVGYVSSSICFSNLFERQRKQDSSSRWTLTLILWFNLRLGVYSIWSWIFIAHHIWRLFLKIKIYSGNSTSSLESAKKVFRWYIHGGVMKKNTPRWFQEYLEASSTRLRSAWGL